MRHLFLSFASISFLYILSGCTKVTDHTYVTSMNATINGKYYQGNNAFAFYDNTGTSDVVICASFGTNYNPLMKFELFNYHNSTGTFNIDGSHTSFRFGNYLSQYTGTITVTDNSKGRLSGTFNVSSEDSSIVIANGSFLVAQPVSN